MLTVLRLRYPTVVTPISQRAALSIICWQTKQKKALGMRLLLQRTDQVGPKD